jgi:branched-chain amino acid transport system permease protein
MNGQFLLGLLVAMLVSFAAGIVIGLPALRVRGIALALLTIAVGALFPDIVLQLQNITGGTSGLFVEVPTPYRGQLVDRPASWAAPSWTNLAVDQWQFYVYAAIAIVCLALVAALIRSRTGRALVAVRDNEIAAEVNGIPVERIKLVTFGISGALAGIGGGLFTLIDFNLTPDAFRLPLSLNLLVIVVIGGSGTTLGPIAGAVAYGLFQDVIAPGVLPSSAGLWTPLILGLGLVLAMQAAPGGTVGSIRDTVERIRRRRGRHGPQVAEPAAPR